LGNPLVTFPRVALKPAQNNGCALCHKEFGLKICVRNSTFSTMFDAKS